MSEADKGYEQEVLKMVINTYLDENQLFAKKNIDEIEANSIQASWDIATKIYQQSGHKVELSLVRDLIDARTKNSKYQTSKVDRRIAEQKVQAQRVSETEKVRHITKSDPIFLSKVTNVLGKFGGDECKAKVFVRVRKVISEQLLVEESEVILDCHLSNHLNADELDLIELLIALEEEFDIEIPEEVAENLLGIGGMNPVSGGSWWGSSSSSPSSFNNSAGEQCIVRNFVELICTQLK